MNISIPYALKRKCYNKGISLFDEKTLEPKTLKRVEHECNSKNNNIELFMNKNSLYFGVPPLPERARAILENNPWMSKKNALMYASNPFYTLKNPTYNAVSPIPGKPHTFPDANHNVWMILPEFFPAPSQTKQKKMKKVSNSRMKGQTTNKASTSKKPIIIRKSVATTTHKRPASKKSTHKKPPTNPRYKRR